MWSLVYLGITASLIGVIGVLGPDFATEALGLGAEGPRRRRPAARHRDRDGGPAPQLYGRYLPRRRVIEGGLIALGILLALLTIAGPLSRVLQRVDAAPLVDLSALTSLMPSSIAMAFLAGIAYGRRRHPGPDAAPGGHARRRSVAASSVS